jgi:hypothetical protein
MSLFLLRVVLIVEILISSLAILNGHGYLSWESVPLTEIAGSIDATYSIEDQHSSWWFFKGISVGMAICSVILALAHRKEIIAGTWTLKVHWVVLIIPVIIVYWYGRNIGHGA